MNLVLALGCISACSDAAILLAEKESISNVNRLPAVLFKISISRADMVIAVSEFRQATAMHKSVHYIPFYDTYMRGSVKLVCTSECPFL